MKALPYQLCLDNLRVLVGVLRRRNHLERDLDHTPRKVANWDQLPQSSL